jgi:hypothetical protein
MPVYDGAGSGQYTGITFSKNRPFIQFKVFHYRENSTSHYGITHIIIISQKKSTMIIESEIFTMYICSCNFNYISLKIFNTHFQTSWYRNQNQYIYINVNYCITILDIKVTTSEIKHSYVEYFNMIILCYLLKWSWTAINACIVLPPSIIYLPEWILSILITRFVDRLAFLTFSHEDGNRYGFRNVVLCSEY